MGIGCSCAEFDGNIGTWLERTYQCVIAVAKHVEVKDIIERIPGYTGLDFYLNYDNSDEYMCSKECTHTGLDNDLMKIKFPVVGDPDTDLVSFGYSKFANTWCPEGERPDENLICKTCDEMLPGCDLCY